MKLVDKHIVIAAPPGDVYALLTQADLLIEWMAPIALTIGTCRRRRH